MASTADYGISAKRKSDDPKRIIQVEIRNIAPTVGAPQTWTRQQVVDAIETYKKRIITIYKKPGSGSWTEGEDVLVVTIDGVKYIRTDANKVKEDNLGSLPDF